VEAVAAGDDVALELVCLAFVRVADARPLGVEVVHADVADLEEQRQAALDPPRDQILHHLGLAVDHDRPTCELAHRHVVTLAGELEMDASVDDPLALHPLPHAELAQQVHGSLLEHTGADPALDVVAVARLEHDALDPGGLQQTGERQTGGAGTDDPDLGSQLPSSSTTRWRTWKALFAAGTPQ